MNGITKIFINNNMKRHILLELTNTKDMQTDLDAEAKRLAGGDEAQNPPQQPLNGAADQPEPNPQIDTQMGGEVPDGDAAPPEEGAPSDEVSDGENAVEDEIDNDEPDEEIDGDLVGQLKDQSYVKDYNHDNDKSPVSPIKIAGMAIDSLYQLKNQVRFQLNKLTLSDDSGISDDSNLEFYQDLMAYVNAVIEYRKTEIRSNDDEDTGNTRPQVAKQNPPKNIKYGEVKPQKFKEDIFLKRFNDLLSDNI